jgi:TsgA-like MFS transporter
MTLDDQGALPWVSLLWGILNFGALKMLIALATDAVKRLPDAMIPGLLLLATAGTAISPLLSSWVVEIAGSRVAMGVGVASLVVMALLALVTSGYVKQSD